MTRRLSGTTSFRSKTPTSPQTADKFTNMTYDYTQQRDVVPNPVFTGTHDGGGYQTMNSGGRPFANTGADIGTYPGKTGKVR